MELNREQIRRALECCLVESNCTGCPLHHQYKIDCLKYVGVKALALIKELIEERDGFENLAYTAIESQNRMSETIEELTDEKNRYKRYYFNHCFDELIANKEADIKADTVRKMQTEIEKRCIEGGIYPAFIKSTIDQIAKEMLEGAQ
jgi:hypothetical protein